MGYQPQSFQSGWANSSQPLQRGAAPMQRQATGPTNTVGTDAAPANSMSRGNEHMDTFQPGGENLQSVYDAEFDALTEGWSEEDKASLLEAGNEMVGPTLDTDPQTPGLQNPSVWEWDDSAFLAHPTFDGFLDENMELKDKYTIESQYDRSYLDDLHDYSSATTPSAWLQGREEGIRLDGANQRDMTEADRQGGLMRARENLAQRRGLMTGASERLEQSGLNQKMMENQKTARNISQEINKAYIDEEASKIGVRKALPDIEAGRATYESGIDKYNTDALTGAVKYEDQREIDRINVWNEIQAGIQEFEGTNFYA